MHQHSVFPALDARIHTANMQYADIRTNNAPYKNLKKIPSLHKKFPCLYVLDVFCLMGLASG
jgi:hypothetical protein